MRTMGEAMGAALVAAVLCVALVAGAQTKTRTVTFDGADVTVMSFTVYPATQDAVTGEADVNVCASVAAREDAAKVEAGCELTRIVNPWTAAKALKAWRKARGLE